MPRAAIDNQCDVCSTKIGSKDPQGAVVDKLSRCTRCKDRFYCCKKCQTIDWQRHKYDCSPLPDEPLPPFKNSTSGQKDEVEQLQKLVSACPSQQELKNNASHPNLGKLVAYARPSLHQMQKSTSFEIPLFAALHACISRSYLIYDILHMAPDERDAASNLLNSIVQPSQITRLYGPKIVARPDALSVGEYLHVARVWPMVYQRIRRENMPKWNELARVFQGSAEAEKRSQEQEQQVALDREAEGGPLKPDAAESSSSSPPQLPEAKGGSLLSPSEGNASQAKPKAGKSRPYVFLAVTFWIASVVALGYLLRARHFGPIMDEL